jgi:EAL domain-containing protein (putative c-di-GMP-specific phosphodiesterase class I)
MPFSKLKIDQSFVRKAIVDSFSLAGVETAVRLASELGIPTVVEGVEEQIHWDLMEQCGATQAQGYLISRPLSFQHFLQWGTDCKWKFTPQTSTRAKLSA